MPPKLPLGPFILCFFLLALPAFAQLDSPTLRVKYGSPLNRETFHVPPGFDLIVDYGAGNQACTLKVPALMPSSEKVHRTSDQNQRMYDFLLDLVPVSMRGKELGRFSQQIGLASETGIEYEHITISELHQGDRARSNDNITVTFKSYDCPSAQSLTPSP
jgi:hypothetical protein